MNLKNQFEPPEKKPTLEEFLEQGKAGGHPAFFVQAATEWMEKPENQNFETKMELFPLATVAGMIEQVPKLLSEFRNEIPCDSARNQESKNALTEFYRNKGCLVTDDDGNVIEPLQFDFMQIMNVDLYMLYCKTFYPSQTSLDVEALKMLFATNHKN